MDKRFDNKGKVCFGVGSNVPIGRF